MPPCSKCEIAPLVGVASDLSALAIQHAAGQCRLVVFNGSKVGEILQVGDIDECDACPCCKCQYEHQREQDPEPPGPDESHANSNSYPTLAEACPAALEI